MLITKSEVVAIAFNRKISETKILDSVIQAAELRYLKPMLGKDLYNAITAAPNDPEYSELIDLIKNALAWWVKYIALPEIFVEISDTGAHLINASNSEIVQDQRFIEVRANSLDIAKEHSYAITEYLNDNDITDYWPGANPQNQVQINGGIIFDTGIDEDDEEDNPSRWYQGRGTNGQTY